MKRNPSVLEIKEKNELRNRRDKDWKVEIKGVKRKEEEKNKKVRKEWRRWRTRIIKKNKRDSLKFGKEQKTFGW